MPTRRQMRPKRPKLKLPQPDSSEVRAWIIGKPLPIAEIYARDRGYDIEVVEIVGVDNFFFRFDGTSIGITIDVAIEHDIVVRVVSWG